MRMFRVRRALPAAVAIALLLPLATSWADVPPSWVQIAQPQDGAVSFGTAVVVNPRNGLVHVLGASFLSGSDYDLGLITYSEAGDKLRARSYQGPPGSSGSTNEYPGGIALDPATDTVYVTGVSEPDTGTTLVTLAYGRTGAAPVWAAEYALPENFDLYASRGIARNPVSGNLYVLAAAPAFVARDQLLLAYGPDGVLLWQATFGQPRDNESPVAVAVDSVTGTVYATGRKYNHASDDTSVYTTAYSTGGVLQWARTAPGVEARALAVDETRGRVYVTGQGPTEDYLTLAYSAAGQTLWSRSAGASEVDAAVDIAVVEATGQVYVTGFSVPAPRQKQDYLTVSYSADGAQVWTDRYDGPAGFYDRAAALVLDSARGLLYVTGSSDSQSYINSAVDVATVAYRTSGQPVRVDRFTTRFPRFDYAVDIALNAGDGNVFLTGDVADRFELRGAALTVAYPSAA